MNWRGRGKLGHFKYCIYAKTAQYAGKFGQLVDMEGYAIARAAELFGKKLEMIKMLTDFSENCDISENITLLRDRLADCEGIWI
ncbi:MAG: hypothetical protein ACLUKN_06720 [Bacilli bacterium]